MTAHRDISEDERLHGSLPAATGSHCRAASRGDGLVRARHFGALWLRLISLAHVR
jgi:hypothetical protein